MVLCLGELGTTDYHSVYILVSDSFAYRSPLKNSFARVKREKIPREIVCSFLILSLEPKKYSYSYTQESMEWSLDDSSKSPNEGWGSSMLSRNELWGDVPLKLSPGSTS